MKIRVDVTIEGDEAEVKDALSEMVEMANDCANSYQTVCIEVFEPKPE